jgi:hypothetical protein
MNIPLNHRQERIAEIPAIAASRFIARAATIAASILLHRRSRI